MKIYTINMKKKNKILKDIIKKIGNGVRSFRVMVGVLASLTVFGGITHALNYMYVNEETDIWERILWHHFYEDKEKIDNLCLGSSHVYCDINPQILDQLSGQYNFNLAGPEQPLNASYYLLHEAGNMNELSHVYLDMYYVCTINEGKLLQYNKNWQNTDYMRPSINKIAYILSIGDTDQFTNILIPFSRYRRYFGDCEYIKERLNEKRKIAYRSYHYENNCDDGNGWDEVGRQGYWISTRIYEDKYKLYKQRQILSECHIGDRNREYVRKIVTYCQMREVPITLFVTPIHDLQLISTLDYDDYVTEVRALAEELGVPFYDFNLVKKEYLSLQESRDYRDEGHLNQFGAEVFTPFFYQVVTGEESDNKKFFYDSYKEKLSELPPTVYGIYYSYPTGQEQIRDMKIASNRDFGLEYKIILIPEGEESYIVQDFQQNSEFQVSAEEHGICMLIVRLINEPNKVQTMAINY